MKLEAPFPSIEEVMGNLGEAGQRLAQIEASEGAAGNISVYLGWNAEPDPYFTLSEPYSLPTAAPELAGQAFLVTGSGRRLERYSQTHCENLGFLRVEEDGRTGTLFTSPNRLFQKLTTEFNSHLAVHRDQIGRGDMNFHAIIHAQPLYMVYLSHIARYQDTGYYSRHVLRWEPECIANLADGIGFLPFMIPGSPELMLSNVKALRDHQIVVWAKHGVMVRSSVSVKKACDLIEYAETGARYEYLNLTNHGIADGLTSHEIRMLCDAFGIEQKIF